MLRHADSFDFVPPGTSQAAGFILLDNRYDVIDGSVVIDDSGLYIPWGNGVTSTSPNQRLRKEIVAATTPITGFHLNPITLSARTICRFLSGGVVHGVLRISADGRIQAYKGDAVTLIAQSDPGVLVANTVVWIECKYHVSADLTLGFVVVGVDDVPVIRERAITKTATAVTSDEVELVLDADTVIDDWLIKDTTGTTHNNFGGEAYVELGVLQNSSTSDPDNNGTTSFPYEWVNSASTTIENEDYINEVPAMEPDAGTYVTNPAGANKRDVHRVEEPILEPVLAIDFPLTAVGVLYRSFVTAGAESFVPGQYHAPSDNSQSGAAIAVSSGTYRYQQAIFPTVANGAAWTIDKYMSSEFGYLTPP